MKNKGIRFVLALLTLIIGAALEDLLPKGLYVGFPVLLAASVYFAIGASIVQAVVFALVAGAAEDSLSSLPFLTSVSFFLLTVTLIHMTEMPYVIAPLVYPVYQIWLCMWVTDLSGSIFSRVLASIPIGIVTMALTALALMCMERRAAVDEMG